MTGMDLFGRYFGGDFIASTEEFFNGTDALTSWRRDRWELHRERAEMMARVVNEDIESKKRCEECRAEKRSCSDCKRFRFALIMKDGVQLFRDLPTLQMTVGVMDLVEKGLAVPYALEGEREKLEAIRKAELRRYGNNK